MFSSSRRLAGALSVAVASLATGGVIAAQAAGTPPVAKAAANSGGVSITPARV
jgi:hypothetical protein